MEVNKYFPNIQDITKAKITLGEILSPTPLTTNISLSNEFNANIQLKREDLQQVRSYKIRGAYNMIKNISKEARAAGVVCASAGNHAQGVAYSCNYLDIKGYIFMPTTTPKQKIEQVKMFGNGNVEIVLVGDTFDAANTEAIKFATDEGKTYIPPFDDPRIIEGQATIGLEIIQDSKVKIDYIFIPIGGGGLAAGLGAYVKQISPETKVIGVEPAGAAGMKFSIAAGVVTELAKIDKFVDGAAVKKVGKFTFDICQKVLDDIIAVPEGAVCSTILELYNKNAIVVEPAGALSIAALKFCREEIKGKNVVCVVSGSNNDIARTAEIMERSLIYEGLKHYFIISFPQRAGSLLAFMQNVLGPTDSISHFSYTKKINREQGPAVIGIELADKSDFEPLIERMRENNISYEYLNDKPDYFEILI